MVAPFGETVEVGKFGRVIKGCDESSEKIGAAGWELGAKVFDEVGDVPRDGHIAGHRKFRAGEEGFELTEEGSIQLRFE